jgi:flagellar hook assembly protein FlgD
VFDVAGRRVTSLLNESQPAGFHTVSWDGTSSSGSRVAAGLYFYTVKYQGKTVAKKMIMVDPR